MMNLKKNRLHNQKGFTLMELLVVIGIIIIISTLALMIFGTSREQFKRQNKAIELKTFFERARFDSVKRRAEITTVGGLTVDNLAKVVVNGTSFTLITDVNQDGDTTDSDDSIINSFGGENITVTGNSMVFPVSVSFNLRGEAIAIDANGTQVNPIFLVCNGTCTFQTATRSNSNIVLVTPTGTVNLLSGDSTIPGFNAPPVTSIPGSDLINSLVSILTGNGTPTPTPTPNGTPDPNGTPTPTPNGTPDPNGTPTPTPDPNGTPTPTPDPNGTPTPIPTVTPTATPTATPTGTPTPTPTATPVPGSNCALTVPTSVTYAKNSSPQTITVSYINAASNVFSMTTSVISGNFTLNVSPTSATSTAASGSFPLTVTYPSGKSGTGTITISGCGSPSTINVTVQP